MATAPSEQPGAEHPDRSAVRVMLVTLVLVAVAGGIFLTVGRLGFNPTDEGYILAQAYRVLHGEVPHRDFICPTPAGSGLLHVADFALPLPLLESSRLVAAGEVVLYSTLLAALTFGTPLRRWGIREVAGVATATLVNLNLFPLMAWHTIDGLVWASAGFVLTARGVDRRSRRLVRLGLLALGTAPLMKQSFFLAPPLGLLFLWTNLAAARIIRPLGRVTAAALLAALPGVTYLVVIAAAGGLGPLLTQIGGAAPVTGWQIVQPLLASDERPRVLGLMAAMTLIVGILDRLRRERGGGRWALAEWALATLGTVLVIRLALRVLGDPGMFFERLQSSSLMLVWALVAVMLLDLVARRALERPATVLLALSWMIMLSYSFKAPTLVLGSVALYLVHRLWRGANPAPFAAAVTAVAAVAAFVVIARASIAIRRSAVYFDRPAAQLNAPLGSIAAPFGGIRTNPVTAGYVRQLVDCLRRYPASRAAVLPDNAFAYPVLGLRNALPINWLFPGLFDGSEVRLLETARRLRAEGDYVVLLQTFSAFDLARMSGLPTVDGTSSPLVRSPLESQLVRVLDGERAACGSFLVVYSPPVARASDAGDRSAPAQLSPPVVSSSALRRAP